MKLFIGADHRGFELKNKIVEYLQQENIRVEDMGPYSYEANDDYVDFSKKVAEAVLQNVNENRGIVLCGSGIGVAMAANRFKGIRCALALNDDQVKHGREHDHINMIAIPAEYMNFEMIKKCIELFLSTGTNNDPKYLRRNAKLDE